METTRQEKKNQSHKKIMDDDSFIEFLSERELFFRRIITQFANEYNVRVMLIEPILNCLGWTAPCYRHSEVVCKRNENGGRADITLDRDGVSKIVIEAKSIDTNLKGLDEQLEEYINATQKFSNNVAGGILTNGYEWRIYKYKGQHLECIIRTDISQHQDFIKLKHLIQNEDDISQRMDDFPPNEYINYESERFYQPHSRCNFRIYSDEGEIEGRSNVERLRKLVTKFAQHIMKLAKNGFFDKIIITDNKDNFQREKCVQIGGTKYFVTKDYSNNYKYLIAKQIITLLDLESKGWSVKFDE